MRSKQTIELNHFRSKCKAKSYFIIGVKGPNRELIGFNNIIGFLAEFRDA